jgi:DNA-binding transcriptional ArsR family regulator
LLGLASIGIEAIEGFKYIFYMVYSWQKKLLASILYQDLQDNMENNYILLNLEDEKSGKIAEIMSNKSCKKILSLLAEKELSESDISRELGLALNTIEYNLNKLVDSGLVEKAKQHFWSVKGKKIPVYKLSNKYIIIAPKSSSKIIRTFLPVVLIIGVGALIVRAFTATSSQVARSSFDKATVGASELVPQVSGSLNTLAGSSLSLWDNILAMPIWGWFLAGALFAIILAIILIKLNGRKNG